MRVARATLSRRTPQSQAVRFDALRRRGEERKTNRVLVYVRASAGPRGVVVGKEERGIERVGGMGYPKIK